MPTNVAKSIISIRRSIMWVNEWMDGWMDGWMNEWTNE